MATPQNSVEWKIEWDNAISEVIRISKDIDLKTGENDKDKIELDSERYNNAILHEKFCERKYYEAVDDEASGGTKKRRLNNMGSAEYGR
jgi:hypothetical protein